MNTINFMNTPGQAFVDSLRGMWYQLALLIPRIVAALVILIIGLILASIIANLIKKAIRYTKIDALFDKVETSAHLKQTGINFTLSSVVAWFIKWFIIIATLITVADTLGLHQITLFLQQIVLYIPNVIVAIAILTIGLVVGDFVSRLVANMLKASSLPSTNSVTVGKIAKYSVVVFSFMAALLQLGIAPQLIEILFAGFVLTLTLAFGLGGREHASRFLERFSRGQAVR
jgi:small-conductance mechanosensitive channel